MSGILGDMKSSLGISVDIDEFDRDIILHTNSILSKLFQIAGSPSGTVPQLFDDTVGWDAVIDAGNETAMIRSYMYLSIRLLFDPPSTSFTIKAMQDQQQEFEWRIRELERVFSDDYRPTQSQYDLLNAKIEAETSAREDDVADLTAQVNAIGSASGSGLPLVGEWQVNPQPGVIPGGRQFAADTVAWSEASYLRFAKIDQTNADMSLVIDAATSMHAQQKANAANWIRFSVTGDVVDYGSYLEVPVSFISGSGSLDVAAWQDGRIVFIIP